MKYYYGITDSNKGKSVTAKQLASIIKRDVNYGRVNKYDGGSNLNSALCKYQGKTFTHHTKLFIHGKEAEFKELEHLIKDIIEVIPREFN